MKRVWIAAAVLALCAGFCLVSFFTVTKDCKSFIVQTEKIKQTVQTEDYESIQKAAKQIKEEWQRDIFSFSLLTTHTHYDTLEECTDKLYHACMQKEKNQIINACDDLIFEASHIIESIRPNVRNVF